MASANQSSGLDQYPDPDNISAAAVNETFGYDGTAIAMQMMLHPVCLYLTAALLSNHAAPVPQNCTLLDRTPTQLCVSNFGDSINFLLFSLFLPAPRTPQGPLPRRPPSAAIDHVYDHPRGHLEALQQGIAPSQYQVR